MTTDTTTILLCRCICVHMFWCNFISSVMTIFLYLCIYSRFVYILAVNTCTLYVLLHFVQYQSPDECSVLVISS